MSRTAVVGLLATLIVSTDTKAFKFFYNDNGPADQNFLLM